MCKRSKALLRLAVVALAAALVSPSGTAAARAVAEPMDIDPEILAKLAKDKATATSHSKQATDQGRKQQKNDQAGAECGSIAIGNVVGGSRIGFQPVDVNVIIVGDVVNANNNCK